MEIFYEYYKFNFKVSYTNCRNIVGKNISYNDR